jgi:hypothetical protein
VYEVGVRSVVERDGPIQRFEQRSVGADGIVLVRGRVEAVDRLGVPDQHRLECDEVFVGLHLT